MTFIKLPFVIKIFVLFIFEWLFYTGFTVFKDLFSFYVNMNASHYVTDLTSILADSLSLKI